MSSDENPEDNIIFRYTSDEAERDGILYNIENANPVWKHGFFSHVTWNLLRKGYTEPSQPDKPERVRLPNLVDLLNQCNQPLLRDFKANTLDWFYQIPIEFPDGHRDNVFVAQNETGRFTIMAPEDY